MRLTSSVASRSDYWLQEQRFRQPAAYINIYTCMSGIPFRISTFHNPIAYTYIHMELSESRFYMYIYSPTLYITYTHTRIGKYFFLFSSGRQWSIWMFVCECTGSPCKTLWWWAYYSERRMALFIYLFIYFFFLSILTHAHVCAYMYACTYVCVCVYVYIYVRPWLALYLSVCYLRDVVVRGWKIFFFFFVVFRWLVDWLIGSWVEDPADLRRDVWRIYYVDAVSISMYMYIRCQRIGIYYIYIIYNIDRRTVYPISKIGCCWCCYYYCRCCCCACSCCWCLVILLYTPFVFS